MFFIKSVFLFLAFILAAGGVYCCTDTYFDRKEQRSGTHLSACERQDSAALRMKFCMLLSLILIACDIYFF